MNNGTFITVAGCWHSMIVVGIVAHTQEFFDKKLNSHRFAQSAKIFGIFEKKLYWVSAVRVAAQVRYNIGENRVRMSVKVQCKYSEKKM